jgi:MOSC domain-containing protein YiiM
VNKNASTEGSTPAHPAVTEIHISPGSRLSMKAVDRVMVEAQTGIVGDRYFGTKHRHVSLQSATDLAEAAEVHDGSIEAQDTRRNITISHGSIPSRPGDLITIGDVQLEVVRIAAPCKLLDDVIGPGAKTALRRRAGSICRALTSGSIAVGDEVTFPPTPPTPPGVDGPAS